VNWWRRLAARHGRRPALTPELRARIRANFEEAADDEEHFPSRIDPRILHVRVVLEHLGDLGGGRVMDVGCGKGRFARIVAERHPRARVYGVDISGAMLAFLPKCVAGCQALMTELPFADASVDAAYATESLEHAVEIEKAVGEICRVVKPGGPIAIIDKNIEQWGRLGTPEWERWFGREELEGLLARHCRQVSSRAISYWDDVAPDGLFLAWLARK